MRCVVQQPAFCCVLATTALVLFGVRPVPGQDLGGAWNGNSTKWLLIICGHPGDQEHRELFADSVMRIRDSLIDRFGFNHEHVLVWFGADEQDEALEECRGPATRETLAEEIAELRKKIDRDDGLWVIVIGHAHPLGRSAQLNLPGPDVTADEFGEWFADFECRQSVFMVTTPLSGYFLKPLANQGRIVISATEADLEVNETLFPSSLAEVLESFPAGETHDVDSDGRHSLLDLYLAVAQHVDGRYTAEELLPTEHAQLDDNGDGRGSELQLNYANAEDSGPSSGAARLRAARGKDGELAKSIDLGHVLNVTQKRGQQ